MNDTLLSVEDLHVGYGPIEAVKGVSLKVRRGEIVTMIGANGAGKTTTLMSISGVLRANRGRILFEGADITDAPAHALVGRGLAQVPEGRRIFPRLSVFENLELGAYLRKDRPQVRADFDRVFHLFPVLRERQSQAGGTLSGGEQQMLAIGRALMSRPKLLLMDEPSMGVAPILTARIFERIRDLNREGMTILLVEQNAHLALRTASRGYVIESGQIVLEDQTAKLLTNPRVRAAYLGED